MNDPELIKAVFSLTNDYFWAWQERDWEKLRSTLATDVKFEAPGLGRAEGIDTHIALYANLVRFPQLTGVSLRRFANNQHAAFMSYDVYLGSDRVASVIDQLSVMDGYIIYVFSVMREWPEGYPDLPIINV